MAWLFLALAAAFEVAFTTSLRYVDGFRNLLSLVGVLDSVALSLIFLDLASRGLPLGTAYAIWTGLGAAGTVAVGIIWFNEPANPIRYLLIAGIMSCSIGLKLVGGSKSASVAAPKISWLRN